MGLLDRAKERAGSLLGDANAHELNRLRGAVAAVAGWEPEIERLTDDQLDANGTKFIKLLTEGGSLTTWRPWHNATESPRSGMGDRERMWRLAALQLPFERASISGAQQRVRGTVSLGPTSWTKSSAFELRFSLAR